MADIFLKSTTGSDANGGTDKGSPKATLASAMTAAGAGGRVFVSDIHAEQQASAMTVTSPGTAASPVQVICVPDWGGATGTTAPTSISSGATCATTGANSISFGAQYTWFHGIEWRAGSGGSAGNISLLVGVNAYIAFESCRLSLVGSAAGARITFGNAAGTPGEAAIDLNATGMTFANTSQQVNLNAVRVVWTDSVVLPGATIPTVVFNVSNAAPPDAEFRGCDFSGAGSGKTIFTLAGDSVGVIRLIYCKLNASVTVDTGTIGEPQGLQIELTSCSSADTNYEWYRRNYMATETHETTIVRSSGASDGTTPISRKIVTTSGAKSFSAYETAPILAWNETVGSSVTVTIPVLTDGVTLTDAEAWVDVQYLGTSGVPLAGSITDRVSDPFFGSAANQTTDATSSWTTTGLASPVKQSLSVTFTPQEKGYIAARVHLAKASTTMYYDPLIISSSGRQFQTPRSFINESLSGGGGSGSVNRAALPSGVSALG